MSIRAELEEALDLGEELASRVRKGLPPLAGLVGPHWDEARAACQAQLAAVAELRDFASEVRSRPEMSDGEIRARSDVLEAAIAQAARRLDAASREVVRIANAARLASEEGKTK